MLNNDSTSSLPSILAKRPERKVIQGWRKPVPKYIPDPPKRQSSLLSNTSALRRMALFASGDDHPPVSTRPSDVAHAVAHVKHQLPDNWKEKIETALEQEQLDVERPASPTPGCGRKQRTVFRNGVTLSEDPAEKRKREEKALPVVGTDYNSYRRRLHLAL